MGPWLYGGHPCSRTAAAKGIYPSKRYVVAAGIGIHMVNRGVKIAEYGILFTVTKIPKKELKPCSIGTACKTHCLAKANIIGTFRKTGGATCRRRRRHNEFCVTIAH